MASPTTVRKASVLINSPGGKGSAEGIIISAAIDTVTSVRVIMHRAGGAVVRPLSADMIAAMAAIQTARFLPKVVRDTTIVAEDGNGGSITFLGYTVAPALSQSKTHNEECINVIGVDAQLNGLGMSIYGSRSSQQRDEQTETDYTDTPSSKTGNISKLIQEITNVLVGNIQATLDEATVESFRNVLELKHEANQVALLVWNAVLENSQVNYPEWAAAFDAYPALRQAAAERTKEMLQQRSSSFWSNVAGLASEFQFFYKPRVDGQPGGFERADIKTGASVKTLVAGVTRFSATDGSPTLLPLAGVVLYGPPRPGLRAEDTPIGAEGAIVGHYPVELTAGYFHEGSPPSWLITGGGFLPFAPEAVEDTETKPKNYDPEDYAARRDGLVGEQDNADKVIGNMLQTYARVIYEDMRLCASTATLELPLDLTLEVGVRYTFELPDNGGSFSGFVAALQHTLQLQGGTALVSASTLSLTHLKYS